MVNRLKHDGPAIHREESLIPSRQCTRCHGKKVTGKKKVICSLCHGTGVQPISEDRQIEIKAILKALRGLTPPSCPEASTKEIFRYIRAVMAMPITLESISRILVYLERDGVVSKRREGPEALWSINETSPVFQRGGSGKGVR